MNKYNANAILTKILVDLGLLYETDPLVIVYSNLGQEKPDTIQHWGRFHIVYASRGIRLTTRTNIRAGTAFLDLYVPQEVGTGEITCMAEKVEEAFTNFVFGDQELEIGVASAGKSERSGSSWNVQVVIPFNIRTALKSSKVVVDFS